MIRGKWKGDYDTANYTLGKGTTERSLRKEDINYDSHAEVIPPGRSSNSYKTTL